MLSRRCFTWRDRTSTTSSSVRSRRTSMRRFWAAAIAIRSVIVRCSSRARIASRMADSIRCWRVIGASGAIGYRSSSGIPWAHLQLEGWRLASGARGRLSLLGFLALPLHAGLFVVLAASCLSQDPRLLDLLVEATQRALERLVLAHADFCQTSRLLPAFEFVPICSRRAQPPGTQAGAG